MDYWDSSAIVAACIDEKLSALFWARAGVSRVHTLAEVFSTLTSGRLGYRIDATEAADLVLKIGHHLEIRDLAASEIMGVFDQARAVGVRGGRVHDFLHAVTAKRLGCDRLLTLNLRDFRGLVAGLEVVSPEGLLRSSS